MDVNKIYSLEDIEELDNKENIKMYIERFIEPYRGIRDYIIGAYEIIDEIDYIISKEVEIETDKGELYKGSVEDVFYDFNKPAECIDEEIIRDIFDYADAMFMNIKDALSGFDYSLSGFSYDLSQKNV